MDIIKLLCRMSPQQQHMQQRPKLAEVHRGNCIWKWLDWIL